MSKAVWDKLGLAVEKDLILINPPENYWEMIGWHFDEYPRLVDRDADILHVFIHSLVELIGELQKVKHLIKENGGIWISYYKASSEHETTITASSLRETVHSYGLTDNKICSINDDWTACRFVIPLKDRKNQKP